MERIYTKNRLMVDLKEHLMREYSASHNHAFSKSQSFSDDFFVYEGSPRDIRGFYFNRAMCVNPPESEEEVVQHAQRFSEDQLGIESRLEGDTLKVKLNDKEYSLRAEIGNTSFGDISMYLSEWGF